jgi:hypothetical protein
MLLAVHPPPRILKENTRQMPRRSRLIAAALVAAAIGAAAPATASAGLMSDCRARAASPVFAPWLDYANYFLAPEGGFEKRAPGWDFDGASIGAGNEPFYLSGAGKSSLHLEAGQSATSPAVCVGLEHPTFRFVARRTAGSVLDTLSVAVVLPDGTHLPVGTMTGGSLWQPSPLMVLTANLLPTIEGEDSVDVRLHFTADSGSWQIDDVYVDPSGSR